MKSFRSRLTLLLLVFIALAVLLTGLFSFSALRRVEGTAGETSAEALTAQVEQDLLNLTISAANQQDVFFSQALGQVQQAVNYTAKLYADALAAEGAELVLTIEDEEFVEQNLFQGEGGQWLNDAAAPTSLFVPNSEGLTPGVRRDLRISAYLDLLFPALAEQNSALVAIYYTTPSQLTRYYPNIEFGKLVSADARITQSEWYLNAAGGRSIWTAPALDAAGLDLVTSIVNTNWSIIHIGTGLDQIDRRCRGEGLGIVICVGHIRS